MGLTWKVAKEDMGVTWELEFGCFHPVVYI